MAKKADPTVEKCPECDVGAKVKTEAGDVVDIPRVPKAEKTQYRISGGKCGSGHKIDTTPKGPIRGSAFGPNLTTKIAFPFFTALGPSSIAKALQAYGPGSVSKTTVLAALAAAATRKFAAEADRISERLGDSFLMADETPIRIGKEWGYVRVFMGE